MSSNRMQMQAFEISKAGSPTMMKADFQYYGDGRIKYAKDYKDDKFDRAFSYDQVGRIKEAYSGSQARGFMGLPDPNPATPPYRQTYQYDVWGNTTGSNGKFWSRDYTSNHSYNPNGQWQGRQYDGAGNLLNDDSNQYSYDAAGRNISVTRNGQNPKTQSLDGDGLMIKQVNYTQLPNPTSYYLRSTVLGGVVAVNINGTNNGPGFLSVGRVIGQTVYGGDAEIAVQTTNANGSTNVSWTHLNPVTNSKGHAFASGEYFHDIEPDPTGASVGLEEPVSNPDPGATPSGSGGIPLFLIPTGGGDPWTKVTVDGVEVSWAEAQQLIDMGVATRAPENTFMPVVWHGERTLGKWQSFADGYQGYVPIGACYGGGGVLKRCGSGNGRPQLYPRYHSGLKDNVAAINGATGEAELGRSSNFRFGLLQDGGQRILTIAQTVLDAQELLKNGDCKRYIASKTQKDPGKLLGDYFKQTKIYHDPGLDDYRVTIDGKQYKFRAYSTPDKIGKDAEITVSNEFFGPLAQDDPNFKILTDQGARVLDILHELSHTTGKYAHRVKPDDKDPSPYEQFETGEAINDAIINKCLKSTKNNKRFLR